MARTAIGAVRAIVGRVGGPSINTENVSLYTELDHSSTPHGGGTAAEFGGIDNAAPMPDR
ncbi:hypothetical protein [Streptomyces sp. NBC_01506]|uniref:hypothetical protein n=1 Tax=Streptomyces sp. NBC_01506 TaxID=2903887 RepID=UPI0038641F93